MKTTSDQPAPAHVVPLADETWGLWRWVFLRSAGFPADGILALADAPCAAAADRLLDTMDGAELPASGDGDATASEIGTARAYYQATYAAAEHRLNHALRRCARDERFREAIAWQNRRALTRCIDAYLDRPEGSPRNHRLRQKEGLIASYMQRYHTKNDTIGFFGPLGWATIVPQGPPLAVRCGEALIGERRLSYELWCVDAVARELAADYPDLSPWLAPWKQPFFHLEGDRYHPLAGRIRSLSREELAIFNLCNGRRKARDIARRVIADLELACDNEGQVYGVLTAFHIEGVVCWTLQVPPVSHAEEVLRQQLEEVGEPSLRSLLLEPLEELDARRALVERAVGDSELLNIALVRLEEYFSSLTGLAPVRLGGQVYAGRTLLLEDCQRDVDVDLGPDFIDALGPPLSLLLTSARWLTWEVARTLEPRLRQAYETVRAEQGKSEVRLVDLFPAFQAALGEIALQPAHVAAFQERWQQLLKLPACQRRVAYEARSLLPRVREVFAAPGPGWRSARHHGVDLLLSAASVEAVGRGDFQLVLGELHVGCHTLHSGMVAQHPEREAVLAALDRDIPEPLAIFTSAKVEQEPGRANPLGIDAYPLRVDMRPIRPQDRVVMLTADPPAAAWKTLLFGELVICEENGEIVVTTDDRRDRFALMDFCDTAISDLVVHQLAVFPPRDHTPRVSIDRLVIQRESWRVPASDVPLQETGEAERFVAVRGWARSLALPRLVFVKSPCEAKPFFIDFDSLPSITLLIKLARAAVKHDEAGAHLGISEMLPDFDHLWLPDAAGRRYTSELRLVARDLAG